MAQDAPAKKKRFRWKKWLAIILLTPVVLFILYTIFVLNWSYSSGERAGYVQKFSKKGVLVKTWEGELAMVNMPGTLPEKFYFTVRDDSVASYVMATLGKRVALSYDEHVGVPGTVFGETPYFVNNVRVIE